MGYHHVSACLDTYLSEDTHTLISRTRIPVSKAYIGFSWLGTEHLHSKDIVLTQNIGDIKTELTERTEHVILIGNFPAIEPHIGTIANTIEGEDYTLTLLTLWKTERGTIPPTRLKLFTVDALIVDCCKRFWFNTVDSQHSHQS